MQQLLPGATHSTVHSYTFTQHSDGERGPSCSLSTAALLRCRCEHTHTHARIATRQCVTLVLSVVVVVVFSYLGRVNPSLLEGAVAGILRAHVSIFAPVTGEVPVHTGQAPAGGKKKVRRRVEIDVNLIDIQYSLTTSTCSCVPNCMFPL